MKRIKIFIAILCAFVLSGNAQQAPVPGAAGVTSGPGGYIKNVREMEQSSANIRFKGEPSLVEQFYNRKLVKKPFDERGVNQPAVTNMNEHLPQYATAQVKSITSESISEPPADQGGLNKVTPQSPGYTALGNEQGGLDPSDAQIAAGPAHIVVLANDDARILNKQTGTVISEVTLAAFFGWSGFVFDPRIMYDPYGQRWVALALQNANSGCAAPSVDSKFRVLVSNNSDPTQGWYWYERDVDANNQTWMDFAKIGFNKDYIVVSGNVRCGSQPIGLYAFEKSQVYAGVTANTWWWNSIELGNPSFTFNNSIDRLFITQTGNSNVSGTGYINTWYISGAPPSPSLTASYSYGTTSWQAFATNAAACPKQAGGSATFTAVNIFGHAQLSNCVYRNGYLWLTHAIFLPATGTTTRVSTQWWQVNPATGAIQTVARIDDATGATSEYYQSIAVNANSDAIVTYSIFNASYFQSAAYNYRNAADPPGLPNGVFYSSGGSYDADGRGGDYSQAAVDPLDDQAFWVVNQVPNGSWETRLSVLPGYYGCYTDASFGNNFWSGFTKNEASNSITSAEIITANSKVDYDAGGFIVMSPGFVATQGCYFSAYINGCGGLRPPNLQKSTLLTKGDQVSQTITDAATGLDFSIHPNPSNGIFDINLVAINDGGITIKIYDTKMNLVATVADNSYIEKGVYSKNMNLSHLPAGLYFCITDANNKVITRKIQILN